jgi:hypothetical protein
MGIKVKAKGNGTKPAGIYFLSTYFLLETGPLSSKALCFH